jgi:hypothetical protein
MGSITRSSPEPDLTLFEVVGDADAEHVLRQIITFLREAPTPLVLWDFSRGSMRVMTSEDLRAIATQAAPYTDVRRGGRTAILCASDVDFGLGRMFQAFVEILAAPFDLMVFRDPGEARAWLMQRPVHRA